MSHYYLLWPESLLQVGVKFSRGVLARRVVLVMVILGTGTLLS